MLKPYQGIWPKIAETAFVEESAQIIGDVQVGEHSSIWFHTVVRGDVNYIRIGSYSNVQDGTVLHVTRDTYPLIVGDHVTLGHRVMAHGCTIRSHTLIGMNATLLDDCEIGEHCIVAAGTLVPEHMKIPSGSLVMGFPGKIKRPLTPEDLDRIERHARNYVEYKNVYLQQYGKR
ncbi:MAG TPA: gamma carbonic anhydrase family protein [Acidobacteriota bacterium]|jgi:carbonic anhydrase/acetyltransferase-like protein (isoleucine patch superfamily)|nr:gamma carbonic anhydrase family protein [Acidobacteriota bacterium]